MSISYLQEFVWILAIFDPLSSRAWRERAGESPSGPLPAVCRKWEQIECDMMKKLTQVLHTYNYITCLLLCLRESLACVKRRTSAET